MLNFPFEHQTIHHSFDSIYIIIKQCESMRIFFQQNTRTNKQTNNKHERDTRHTKNKRQTVPTRLNYKSQKINIIIIFFFLSIFLVTTTSVSDDRIITTHYCLINRNFFLNATDARKTKSAKVKK